MSLREDLMEIRGIGDAKADAILDVLAESDTDGVDVANFREGMSYFRNGDYGYAMKFFRRVEEGLEE